MADIKAGVEQYYLKREEGDLDLVLEVRNALVEVGLLQKVLVAYDGNRFINEATGKASSVQRFLLNRYWNQELIFAEKPSIEERYCLIPNGTVEDWLRLFKAKVLPFVIAHDLPIKF